MQKLLCFNHHHPTTITPSYYHQYTFPHPSCNVFLKPKVSCNLRLVFTTPNFLFNQPLTSHKTWQLHFTRGIAPPNGAVKGLILANVVVFLLWKFADKKFMSQNFTVNLDNFNSGRYHTLITHSFSHKDVTHIISNMMALYFSGNRIGQLYGSKFLLKLYLVGAFTGSASSLLHQAFLTLSSKDNQVCEPDLSKAAALGASDAVQAIFMLDKLLTPVEVSLFGFTIPAHALLAGKIVWEDIKRVKENAKISGSAHLGGAAVGIFAWAWLGKRRS